MNTNLGLGPAIPLSSASPRAVSTTEYWGDKRRNKAERPRMAPIPDDQRPVLDENPLLGAPMRGALERPVITKLEAMEARRTAAAAVLPAVESPDMSQVLSMLTAILERLDSLEARVTILDGAAVGEL
jgi:hypothetical protein